MTSDEVTHDLNEGSESYPTKLLGEHSESEPPDPIPNSEVKPLSADDSVAGCHAKVGNCQASNLKTQNLSFWVFFCLLYLVQRIFSFFNALV